MANAAACPICGGTGWKIVERDGLSGAECCDCVPAERAKQLLERANIPPRYRHASFDNFIVNPGNPVTGRILQNTLTVAGSYAREFPAGLRKQGLLFIGDPGTGKTHLAVAVLRRLIAKGFEGVFLGYQDLLEKLKQSYDLAAGGGSREAYRLALECEVLLLDDLGAQKITDWVEDTITSIITHRCNHNKPLIATTNLRDPEAGDTPIPSGAAGDVAGRYYLSERIGVRARSRLLEMCRTVSTRGVEDYRPRVSR